MRAWRGGREIITAPLPSQRGAADTRAGLRSRGTALRLLARHPTRLLARPFCRRPPHCGRPEAESLRARAAEAHKERLDGWAAIVHVLRAPLHPVGIYGQIPSLDFKHGRI
jgi:hypothetical protein